MKDFPGNYHCKIWNLQDIAHPMLSVGLYTVCYKVIPYGENLHSKTDLLLVTFYYKTDTCAVDEYCISAHFVRVLYRETNVRCSNLQKWL